MKFRKLTSTIVALAIFVCMFTPIAAFATADPVVGVLTIYASAPTTTTSSINTAGHAWISFKCTTWPSVEFGGLMVSVNNEVTVGTFGNHDEHIGIWYNLESYCVNKLNSDPFRVSISMNVKRSEVYVLNAHIDSYDSWSFTNNCSSFAERMWNAVSEDKEVDAGVIDTPENLMESIMEYDYEVACPIVYNSTIGYVSGITWYSSNPYYIAGL